MLLGSVAVNLRYPIQRPSAGKCTLYWLECAHQWEIVQAGQTAYKDRLAELRMVKANCLSLQKDISMAKKDNLASADLKREQIYLEKKLRYEQAKTQALSQELETRVNVHR